jgi:hypothetical protein
MDIESIMASTNSTRYAVQLALRSLQESGMLESIASDPVPEVQPLISPQDNPFGAEALYWLATIFAACSLDDPAFWDKSFKLPDLELVP